MKQNIQNKSNVIINEIYVFEQPNSIHSTFKFGIIAVF